MIVSFNVPNAVATELNQYAVSSGFANAKAMTIAYWRAALQGVREKALRDTLPSVNTNDVTVS